MRRRKWLILACLLTALLPLAALLAPGIAEDLLRRTGPDPAVAALLGEYRGKVLRALLLAAAPLAPPLCFLLEQAGLGRARWRQEAAKPPEFAGSEERRAFYLRELAAGRRKEGGTPWIAYAALCGIGVLLFGSQVLRADLPGEIARTGRDLAMYRAGTPAVYQGPLLLVDRPVRNGAKQIPDPWYVYYRSGTAGDLQCAAALIPAPQLMQPSYRVEYLPESGTVLSITDEAGNLRTGGEAPELPTPAGCWMYGDLAVPVCDQAPGYDQLTRDQQALFDLLYSQVLSGDVAAGKLPTRSFDLPQPLEKAAFNQVLELYEAAAGDAWPNHGYRTDDGKTVRRAYCYGIVYVG